jgi:asparagine synthase (glutamine-hydrolysing)
MGYDGRVVDREELLRIRDAMTARGPDDAGCWISADGVVGMGHRRLSLLDLSGAGAQPMSTSDEALRIVFNGEIYNYLELRHRLEKKHYCFKSGTDTEVLLHLYADKAETMLAELRGMYAFVIWDQRRRRIFAARDPLGIKPLYYADDDRFLRIGSQVKALMCGGAIAPALDSAGQAGFLSLGYVPDPFTLNRNIKAVPAGTYLTADRVSRASIHPFCRIEDELATAAEQRGKSKEVISEAIHAALANSVDRHLIADVPVGVFLSAGLDSSVLTALAAENPKAQLKTVTLGFEEYRGSQRDETMLAESVAARYGTYHQTRWVKRHEFHDAYEQLLAAMDQPSIDGINTYFVARASREAGLKAALSGVGGDEIFGGYPSFTQVPKTVTAFSGINGSVIGRALRMALSPALSRVSSAKYAGIVEYGGTWGGAYLLRRALFMPWEIPGILEPEIAEDGLNRLELGSRLNDTVRWIDSPLLKVSALEVIWYMRNQLLRDADWAGMAHSLEIRTPLADIEVLRAVAPYLGRGELKQGKGDLAGVPVMPLPRSIAERKKTGFTVPVREWTSNTSNRRQMRGLRGWAIQLAAESGFDLIPPFSAN